MDEKVGDSIQPAALVSQPQVSCQIDAGCMLFDIRRTSAVSMACGGGQCVKSVCTKVSK